MNRAPVLDLLLLLIVFLTSWYLKSFLPTYFQGPAVVLATVLTGFLIMKIRGISFKEVGFIPRTVDRTFTKEAIITTLLIFGLQVLGILGIGSLVGSPETGNAISQLPESLIGFILDIVLVTWIVTGFGEEFIFRGIVTSRLQAVFKNESLSSNIYLISALQAIWFGSAHPSQGISGILITGIIGFGIGIYYLKNRDAGLWPIVVAHAIINTTVLSITYFT